MIGAGCALAALAWSGSGARSSSGLTPSTLRDPALHPPADLATAASSGGGGALDAVASLDRLARGDDGDGGDGDAMGGPKGAVEIASVTCGGGLMALSCEVVIAANASITSGPSEASVCYYPEATLKENMNAITTCMPLFSLSEAHSKLRIYRLRPARRRVSRRAARPAPAPVRAPQSHRALSLACAPVGLSTVRFRRRLGFDRIDSAGGGVDASSARTAVLSFSAPYPPRICRASARPVSRTGRGSRVSRRGGRRRLSTAAFSRRSLSDTAGALCGPRRFLSNRYVIYVRVNYGVGLHGAAVVGTTFMSSKTGVEAFDEGVFASYVAGSFTYEVAVTAYSTGKFQGLIALDSMASVLAAFSLGLAPTPLLFVWSRAHPMGRAPPRMFGIQRGSPASGAATDGFVSPAGSPV
jgi:hypothetical protein